MSISNTTTKQIYAGNGVATSFPIPFSFIPGLLTTIKVSNIVYRDWETDRKSTRLNSSHRSLSRMPSSA